MRIGRRGVNDWRLKCLDEFLSLNYAEIFAAQPQACCEGGASGLSASIAVTQLEGPLLPRISNLTPPQRQLPLIIGNSCEERLDKRVVQRLALCVSVPEIRRRFHTA